LSWHAFSINWLFKNILSGKILLAGGYQIVMESKDQADVMSKKENKLKMKLSLRQNEMFYLQGNSPNGEKRKKYTKDDGHQ
jgi:hypothetical protein